MRGQDGVSDATCEAGDRMEDGGIRVLRAVALIETGAMATARGASALVVVNAKTTRRWRQRANSLIASPTTETLAAESPSSQAKPSQIVLQAAALAAEGASSQEAPVQPTLQAADWLLDPGGGEATRHLTQVEQALGPRVPKTQDADSARVRSKLSSSSTLFSKFKFMYSTLLSFEICASAGPSCSSPTAAAARRG